MHHGNRTPVWPVQFILFGLFLAAVLAPRAWEKIAHRDAPPEPRWSSRSRWAEASRPQLKIGAATEPAAPAVEVPDELLVDSLMERLPEPAVMAEVRWKPVFPTLPPRTAPTAEHLAARHGRLWLNSGLETVYALLWEPLHAQPVVDPPLVIEAPVVAQGPAVAERETPIYRPAMRMPMVRRRAPTLAWWPEELLTRLAQLSDDPQAGLWAWQVAIVTRELAETSEQLDATPPALVELERLAEIGRAAAERSDDPVVGPRWRRTVSALERRIRVWRVGAEAELAAEWLDVYAPTVKTARNATALALTTLVERYEADPSPAVARRLAQTLECLSQAGSPAARELASQFELANVRLAVSDGLLSRLAPAVPDVSQPVSETMDGARVRGESTATRRLRFELVPDPAAFRVLMAASGEVTARTVATKGPGRWFNRADGSVDVARELLVGPKGFQLEPATADATASVRILDVRTKLDGLPIFDDLLRMTLRNAGQRKTPQARRRFQSRVEREAVAELERMSDEKLAELEDLMEQRLKAPLREMGVRSHWVAGQTTAERASLRIRVAGEHQLGAHTPRPRAPGNSLASLQLHQSACNNVIEQLDLAGETFLLPDLFAHVAAKLHRSALTKVEGLPDGVSVTFASADPVVLSFKDGNVELALRIKRLASPDQTWRDFVVRAIYTPEAETGRLERSESIRLASTSGSRLSTRSQIALRSIFTKVFSKNQRIDLLKPLRDRPGTADLIVSQFKADDGWLAVAIAAAPAQDLARRPAAQAAR